MRNPVLAQLTAFLGLWTVLHGCGFSHGVVPSGLDTFTVEESGGMTFNTGGYLLQNLLIKADAFCREKGFKNFEQVSSFQKDSGFAEFGSATLTFRCVKEGGTP